MGLLLAAHLRRTKVTTRSDSNIQQVERDSTFARRVRQMLMRAAFPRATRVWTVGEKNQEYWNKYLRRKNTRLIPYSTPELPNSTGSPPQPRRSDPNAMNFLFVGRLDPVKNIETVILAFLSIDATISKEWSFTIVGDGPSRGALQELAVGDPRIHFTGAIAYPELDRYYLPADVVLLPSLAEPWGLVVNEGLAFGSRVLISDQVGASELLVGHPERGSVLQARDVGAWQEAMTQSVDYLDRVPVPPYDPTQDMLDDLRALGGVR
ncbi:glycosyltransferase family 4 protein [Flexivirga sp.]|uniref:glycosyltransferase family 4 protein n=1 Tax=Flexivirga sp. TaxID=1962927 RepID=UPI003F81A9D9